MTVVDDEQSHESGSPTSVETLIFLDVDGVLNVGVREKNGSALLVSKDTGTRAAKMWSDRGGRVTDSCRRLATAWNQRVRQEEKRKYSDLACNDESHLCTVFIRRLAHIMEVAGQGATVVLSSSWRLPHRRPYVQRLEEVMSDHTGENFEFDATTVHRKEGSPAERLRCIGDFIENHLAERSPPDLEDVHLRVLVLDDFFVQALTGVACEGHEIESTDDAQDYLEGRAPEGVDISAKVIHTYDEFVMSGGQKVGVGCGLTRPHYRSALRFLHKVGNSGSDDDFSDDLDDGPAHESVLGCSGLMSLGYADTVFEEARKLWLVLSAFVPPGCERDTTDDSHQDAIIDRQRSRTR